MILNMVCGIAIKSNSIFYWKFHAHYEICNNINIDQIFQEKHIRDIFSREYFQERWKKDLIRKKAESSTKLELSLNRTTTFNREKQHGSAVAHALNASSNETDSNATRRIARV